MADFKISIDTELKTTGIDGQIQKIKSDLENAVRNIRFGLDVNTASTHISELLRATTEGFQNVRLNIDTRNAEERVRSLQEQLNNLNNNGGGNNNAGQQAREMAEAGNNLALTFQEANMIMNQSLDIIHSMVDEVMEMDSALTEFKKVSDLSGESLNNYVNQLQEMGSTVARTG